MNSRWENRALTPEARAFVVKELEGFNSWQLNAAGLGKGMYFMAAVVFVVVVVYEEYNRRKTKLSKLPPGPFQWPVLGCLPQLWRRKLSSLRATTEEFAKKYGPLTFLQIADAPFVVVSSGELAKEVLVAHDGEFYYRPSCSTSKYLGFGSTDIAFSTGKPHSILRKLCDSRLFSPTVLASYGHIHKDGSAKMVQSVWEASKSGGDIQVRSTIVAFVRNSLCRMLLGTTHMDIANISIQFTEATLYTLMDKAVAVAGEVTLSDLTPGLKWLNNGGRAREMKYVQKMLEKYFQVVIDERRRLLEDPQGEDSQVQDIIDVLLLLKDRERIPDKAIMGILLDTLVGGTYTTTSTVEWALAELVRHPVMLEKVQDEITKVVGSSRMVEEVDLPKLPYFQAVVKETLRLHPAMPLSLPHMNIVTTPLAKYEIPASAMVVIDYAAIGRDPTTWQDPLEFEPTRFLHTDMASQIDMFKLLPFGYGRRACPGVNLGLVLVQLALASLVQGFEWLPIKGCTPHDIDINESSGVVCSKATPLVLSASPRLPQTFYEL